MKKRSGFKKLLCLVIFGRAGSELMGRLVSSCDEWGPLSRCSGGASSSASSVAEHRLSAGKESACNVGDPGPIPGLGRPPGGGKGYPLQYSGLENSMDCTVHWVAKGRTRLSDVHALSGSKRVGSSSCGT